MQFKQLNHHSNIGKAGLRAPLLAAASAILTLSSASVGIAQVPGLVEDGPTPRGAGFPASPFANGKPPSGFGGHYGSLDMPSFSADHWKTVFASRLPIGTVLSGILESDLSSDESKAGDVFTIVIEDGYSNNGAEVIPPHSKIVGSVVAAVPSKYMNFGHPGQIQISLQTLVFPDGRHIPFHGQIANNPNAAPKIDKSKDQPGEAVGYYAGTTINLAKHIGSTISQRTIGVYPKKKHRGNEFEIDAGELLAIRVTRSMDMTQLCDPPPAGTISGAAPSGAASPVGTSSGLVTGGPPGSGGVITPGTAGVASPSQPSTPTPSAKLPLEDPNAIFNQSQGMQYPRADLPDPF